MQARVLYANTTTKILSATLGGGALDFPTLIAGEDLVIALRFTESQDGSAYQSGKPLHALKASLGRADRRPETGGVQLHIGSEAPVAGVNVTDVIQWNETAESLQSKINALTDTTLTAKLDCVVTYELGTYSITFADGTQVAIACVENTLWPISFVEVTTVQRASDYTHEIRFTQTPVAATVEFTPVVSPPPTITSEITGSADSGQERNAVQKLAFPATFPTGAFIVIKRDLAPSLRIGLPTSAAEVQVALKPLASVNGSFVVTDGDASLLIEFAGSMGAQPQDLLTVEVFDLPDGDPTFIINTDKAEMWALMRRSDVQGNLALTLSIDVYIEDEIDSGTSRLHSFQRPVTFTHPVNRAMSNVSANLIWNQPPSTTREAPFSPSNLLITTHAYPQLCGDGAATAYVINHNLGSNYLDVIVRENADGGRQLSDPADFTVVFTNANSCIVTFATAPTTNQMLVVIRTSDLASTWATGVTWEIADVVGLAAALATLAGRVTAVESAVGITGGGTTTQTGDPQPSMIQPIAKVAKLLPWGRGDQIAITDLGAVETSRLRTLGLLNAVHAASVTAIPAGPPEPNVSYRGIVYQNQTGADIQLTGGSGHKAPIIPPNGYALCNGLIWYAATRYGTEKTYYPTDFELTLMPPLVIDGDELTVGSTFSFDFGLQLAAFRANTNASWVLEIRHGLPTSETSPSGVGVNLKNITWNATPIYSKQLILTAEPRTRLYNLSIARSLVVTEGTPTDTLTTSVKHGNITTGTTGPSASASFGASKPFVVGIFLCRGDFEDTNPDMRGFVGVVFPSPANIAGTTNATLGQAIIQPS